MSNTFNIKEQRVKNFQALSEINNILVELNEITYDPAITFISQSEEISNEYHVKSISFRNENVIDTINNTNNAGVLIFASAKNPGGGVLNGSIAQEEAISYHTTWFFQAKENKDFYLEKGASALNTDKLSIAKGFILTDINHQQIEPKPILFIACAAPNKTGIISQNLKIKDDVIYHHLDMRIETILHVAQQYKVENLILGAFGCGVFGLDPNIVAKSFKNHINKGLFNGNIIFSIMDNDLIDIFKNHIGELSPKCKDKNLKHP